MNKVGQSYGQIAKLLIISKTCVKQTIQRYRAHGTVEDTARSGRPRKTTKRQDRLIVRQSKDNRCASAPEILAKVKKEHNIAVSVRTISNRLTEAGLRSYFALRKPLLTDEHCKRRLEFCHSKIGWDVSAWRRVVFSDECRFKLFPRKKVRVRRTRTEKFLPSCVAPAVQKGGDAIMIWGAITTEGPTRLSIVEGAINSDDYIETMSTVMLPRVRELMGENFIYQQDNAPCHGSKKTRAWFAEQDIDLLDHPARSPDFNPIENLWEWMGRELMKEKPRNKEELREEIEVLWDSISEEHCRVLIDSMPKRMRDGLQAKGSWIDY